MSACAFPVDSVAPIAIDPDASGGPMVRAGAILPVQVDGAAVVGAWLQGRPVSLDALVPPFGVTPITTADWLGREIFRNSAGLALLEAARRVGLRDVRLGPSITTGRLVLLPQGTDAAAVIDRLGAALSAIVRDALPFREEVWNVEAAIDRMKAQGWDDAAMLLTAWKEPAVVLAACGEVRAIAPGPLLPRTDALRDIAVLPYPSGLLLDFGAPIRRVLAPRPMSTMTLERRAPRYGGEMTAANRRWLEALEITSVGGFNAACVAGRVEEIVRVSEGLHEKHIAALADEVVSRGGVRIVAIAGPSASGKTTFIKRLKVQLAVNGIHPLELSLDDYFVDRERCARDADGHLDFESVSALDLEALDRDIGALLAGKRVRTPRFDFVAGRSLAGAGPELSLPPGHVLLVEGIHGLNPRLFGCADASAVYRAFVHPATSLPYDRLSWLEPADLRLVRRIVRDRRMRGCSAVDNLRRWSSVRRGERVNIQPHQGNADRIFDSSLVYEASVLKVYAERYLLEVPRGSPQFPAAQRLRKLLDPVVPIDPDHVPPTSILREFIGKSGFSY